MSSLSYVNLNPQAQAIVVVCPVGEARHGAEERWRDQAAALIYDTGEIVRDVVRDLLANPQIRSVVFYGDCCGRQTYADLWSGKTPENFRISREHLELVRGNVDLYDDEIHFWGPRAPYWPTRIMYLE